MKRTATSAARGRATGIILCLFLSAFLFSCAPGAILKWNQVDAAAVMKGQAGNEKFNTIRVASFGPYAEQIYGYFLYRDGIEVITGGGASIERLGKLTMGEVAADYSRVVNRSMYDRRTLVTREIYRGSGTIGYTVTDFKLDADLWDITPAGQESKPVIRLEYRDRRTLNSGGDGKGILDSSD